MEIKSEDSEKKKEKKSQNHQIEEIKAEIDEKNPIAKENPIKKNIIEVNEKKKTIPNEETFKVSLEIPSDKLNYKPIERILYLEELGKGGFGKVYKAFDYNINNLIALKIIKNQYYNDNIVSIIKEVDLLQKLNNLNHMAFIKFHNIFTLQNSINLSNDIGLSMEYGLLTLKEALEMKKYKISEIIYILRYLTDGLFEAQKIKVANRDIKPDNIILVKNQKKTFQYKFIDFGIGCILDENQGELIPFNRVMGLTEFYAAPELLKFLKEKDPHLFYYNPFKADVYSLGVTILKMMDYSEEEIQVMKRKCNLKSKNKEKMQLLELIKGMMEIDPEKRLDFSDIIKKLSVIASEEPIENNLIDKKNLDKRWVLIGDISKILSKTMVCKAFDKHTSEFVLIEFINISDDQQEREEMIRKNNIIKDFQNLQHFCFAEVLSMLENQTEDSRTFHIIREYGDTLFLSILNNGISDEFAKEEKNPIYVTIKNLILSLLSGLVYAEQAELILNNVTLENIIIKKVNHGQYAVKFLDTSRGYKWRKGDLTHKSHLKLDYLYCKNMGNHHSKNEISEDNEKYLPPELRTEEPVDPYKIDVYSAGILIRTLINKFHEHHFTRNIFSGLIESMTDPNFEKRPYFSEIMNQKILGYNQITFDPVLRTEIFNYSAFYLKYQFRGLEISIVRKIVKEYCNLGCYSAGLDLCNIYLIEKSRTLQRLLWYLVKIYKIQLKIGSSLKTNRIAAEILDNLYHFLKRDQTPEDKAWLCQVYAFLMLNQEEPIERVIEYNEKAIQCLKEDNKELVRSYQISTLVYLRQNDLQKAKMFNEKAIKIKKSLGKNLFKEYLMNCVISMESGNWKEAISNNKMAEKIKKHYGEKHLDLATCMKYYSIIYEKTGKEVKALEFTKREYRIILRYFDKDHEKAKEIESRIKLLEKTNE